MHAAAPASHRFHAGPVDRLHALFSNIPLALLSLMARVSIGVTFWLSGQTKVENLVVDPVGLEFSPGWPRLSESAVGLFETEYMLPLLSPHTAAVLAAVGEHVLPLLLVLGLGTRMAALGLLAMTLVIQVFVYPAAYATHMLWATALLLLMARGAGPVSIDAWIARWRTGRH